MIDGAKAISAMLPHRNSVLDHLEDVGRNIPHSGIKTPFIAVPTTSGTGGEMTKNAVLSAVGPQGYKKSLRHENLIPDLVVIDPQLMLSCPRDITAACGMDALTQLLEPLLSPLASPFTDALALSGLAALIPNLEKACDENLGARSVEVRGQLAYASMLSGITLANAGLGIVHGLASPLGGYFPIPHGVVCGTLVAEAMSLNLQKLRQGQAVQNAETALAKMAAVGRIFSQAQGMAEPRNELEAWDALIEGLKGLTERLNLPRLSRYGVTESDLSRIAEGARNRHNPVTLNKEEMMGLLRARL